MVMDERERYIAGLLMGDGTIQHRGNQLFFFFSSVHLELASLVQMYSEEKGWKTWAYTRPRQEENWGDLHLVEFQAEEFLALMEQEGFVDKERHFHLQDDAALIRGYFETKATLFSYDDKGTPRYRISFSGTEALLLELQAILAHHQILVSDPVQRKDREHLGITSQSYRININRREYKMNLLDWLYPEGSFGSVLFRQKVDLFWEHVWKTPLNMISVYKNPTYAARAMAKHLRLEAKGQKGGAGGGRGAKPITILDRKTGEVLHTCLGWEEVYHTLSRLFQQKTGLPAPQVEKKA